MTTDFSLIVFLQLVLAMLLGLMLGAERSIAGKTAGTRTFSLVAMGSCLFIIASTIVTTQYIGITSFDPLRMAAGVVTGIGFLGAGIIIFKGEDLQGLTTAAGLWVAAGIGVAVGFQLYAIAVFATLLTLLAFAVLWRLEAYLERRFDRPAKHRITVEKER